MARRSVPRHHAPPLRAAAPFPTRVTVRRAQTKTTGRGAETTAETTAGTIAEMTAGTIVEMTDAMTDVMTVVMTDATTVVTTVVMIDRAVRLVDPHDPLGLPDLDERRHAAAPTEGTTVTGESLAGGLDATRNLP